MSLFNKLRLDNFRKTLKEVSFRFPVSVFSSVVAFFLFSYQIYFNNLGEILENILFKSIISVIIVFFLSASVSLMMESLKKSSFFSKNTNFKILGYSSKILVVLFGLIFYYFLGNQTLNSFDSEEISYKFLIFIGVISFLFFSPFVKKIFLKSFSQDVYYNYFLKISFTFLISFILGGALTLLGFIGIWATFALFDLDFAREGDFYSHFANFSLVLFTPFYFLSQLPKKVLTNKKIDIHSFFKFLIKYISIPFIFLYFFILYAYTIKVLLNFSEWPHQEVSWMVIGFSIFGYLIYIFSYGFEKENTFIKSFRKYFPLAVIFQVLMLFYAIFLRINQYDFTINRYFVVVFGLWLMVISIYLLFSKKKLLPFISMILFSFIIIISIGPWSVYNFPEGRQINILNKNLLEANILVDDKIIILDKSSDIDAKISGKIYDLIGYLVNNHGILSIEKVFPELIKEIKEEDKIKWESRHILDKREYYGISNWTVIYKLRNKLKVKAYYPGKSIDTKYINFRLDYNLRNTLLDIKGYDYMFEIGNVNIINSENILYSANYYADSKIIHILKNGITLEKFNFSIEIEDFYDINKDLINNFGEIVLEKPFELIGEGEKINIKVIFSNFSILNPDYSGTDNNSYINLFGKVLIREN